MRLKDLKELVEMFEKNGVNEDTRITGLTKDGREMNSFVTAVFANGEIEFIEDTPHVKTFKDDWECAHKKIHRRKEELLKKS
jgi:hypothetical protein